jgi:hypothetical protein
MEGIANKLGFGNFNLMLSISFPSFRDWGEGCPGAGGGMWFGGVEMVSPEPHLAGGR